MTKVAFKRFPDILKHCTGSAVLAARDILHVLWIDDNARSHLFWPPPVTGWLYRFRGLHLSSIKKSGAGQLFKFFFSHVFQKIAGLTVQCFTYFFQRGKTDRFRLSRFQYAEIGYRFRWVFDGPLTGLWWGVSPGSPAETAKKYKNGRIGRNGRLIFHGFIGIVIL